MSGVITGVFTSNASRFQTWEREREWHVQCWFGGDLAQFSIFSNVYIKKPTFMEKCSWTTSFKKKVGFPNYTYFGPSARNYPLAFLIQLWKCRSTFSEWNSHREHGSNALELRCSLSWSVDQPKMECEWGETWIIVQRRRECKSTSFESRIEIIWIIKPNWKQILKLKTLEFGRSFLKSKDSKL